MVLACAPFSPNPIYSGALSLRWAIVVVVVVVVIVVVVVHRIVGAPVPLSFIPCRRRRRFVVAVARLFQGAFVTAIASTIVDSTTTRNRTFVVADLSTEPSATVLSTGMESGVQFHSYDIPIEFTTTQHSDGLEGIGTFAVLNETKSTGFFPNAIETHMYFMDRSQLCKKGCDVSRPCGKGQIAHIDGRRLVQGTDLIFR